MNGSTYVNTGSKINIENKEGDVLDMNNSNQITTVVDLIGGKYKDSKIEEIKKIIEEQTDEVLISSYLTQDKLEIVPGDTLILIKRNINSCCDYIGSPSFMMGTVELILTEKEYEGYNSSLSHPAMIAVNTNIYGNVFISEATHTIINPNKFISNGLLFNVADLYKLLNMSYQEKQKELEGNKEVIDYLLSNFINE